MNACIAPSHVLPCHGCLVNLIIKGDLVLARSRIRVDARSAKPAAATTAGAAETTTTAAATAPVKAASATASPATTATAAAPAATRVAIAGLRIVQSESTSSSARSQHGTTLAVKGSLRILDGAELHVSKALQVTRLPVITSLALPFREPQW